MNEHPRHDNDIMALKRVEGQIRGVQKMIEEGKYCVDILTQIQAVIGATTKVGDNILERHIEQCVVRAVKGKSARGREEKFKELLQLMRKCRKV